MAAVVDTSMEASEMSSPYLPPQTPDHCALSVCSDASDDSDFSLDSPPSSPPLRGLDALDLVGAEDLILDDADAPIGLDDPYAKPTSDGVWLDLMSAPNQQDLLREWITTLLQWKGCSHVFRIDVHEALDDEPESPEAHFENLVAAATAEESIRRLVVERYADHLAQQNAHDMEHAVRNLEPARAEVNDLLERTADSFDAGAAIASTLAAKVDLYAWMVPAKSPAYSKGKESVLSLLALAEGVLAAPSEKRRGIMSSTVVGIKLGLAFQKILTKIPARTYGFYKRFGLKNRVQVCVASWTQESTMGDVEWVANLS